MNGWTSLDQEELDCLLRELARGFDEHRKLCRACRPCDEPKRWRVHKAGCPGCAAIAPLTFEPCERRAEFNAHVEGCKRCSGPCPHVRNAIAIVLDWREGRQLLSLAGRLGAERARLEAA